MKVNYKSALCLLIFLSIISCKQVQKVSDAITKPSAREIFERNLKANDSIYQFYLQRYTQAKSNRLQLKLPTVVATYSDSLEFPILAYTIALERGERFKIESPIKADSLQLSIDLFEIYNDSVVSSKPIAANDPKQNILEFDVLKSSKYKVVIFPNQKKTSSFDITLYSEPTLEFPVSGKGNRDIQSFWGADRAGGKRLHKGIDIFAKRGTPVIAATDGYIYNTGNRGLGGKQVWLRDGIFGHSLYYAHLDSIVVASGDRAKRGDTLGFVGITGNARTTTPHLHFGIYTSAGAIDPLPFVRISAPVEIKENTLFINGLTQLNVNELRSGAGVKSEKIQELPTRIPVKILGKTALWFHLKMKDSVEGFMHESLVKEDLR